jgi:hypothetical protein
MFWAICDCNLRPSYSKLPLVKHIIRILHVIECATEKELRFLCFLLHSVRQTPIIRKFFKYQNEFYNFKSNYCFLHFLSYTNVVLFTFLELPSIGTNLSCAKCTVSLKHIALFAKVSYLLAAVIYSCILFTALAPAFGIVTEKSVCHWLYKFWPKLHLFQWHSSRQKFDARNGKLFDFIWK